MSEHLTEPKPSVAEPPDPRDHAPESRERIAAWRRGREATDDAPVVQPDPTVIQRAFAALAENVRDYAIFLLDPEGVITFWGEGARLMKWWTRREVEGSHLRLLYPDGGSEDGTAEEHLAQSAATGEYSGEGLRVRSDGSTFWAGVTLTALRDESGRLLGFAKVTRDLTARRAADDIVRGAALAAERARAAAVAADDAKSGFLATMSHEIRTPINAIIGYHDLLDLGLGGPLTDRQREYVARAVASGRHLLMLVDEVLDFSRVESGHVEVEAARFRLGDVVAAAIQLVEPQARARGLDFVDATSGYAADEGALGDESRVRQVLVNLLANAVKFTPGGGRITVSAGAASEPSPEAQVTGRGPWVYVRVEDTGIGIAPDRLAAVFEPFVQGDMALTRAHGGTGLGLAIGRRLARLMGGDLTARSEPGVGSAFFLWLPAAGLAKADTTTPSVTPPIPDPATNPDPATGAEGTLHDVADTLLAELERTLHAFVRRLRTDPAMPAAHSLGEADLEDHFATFIADLARTLTDLDPATAAPSLDHEASLRDGSEIQRLVARRHGRQRARLGWTEPELVREFAIIREELTAAVRRHRTGLAPLDLAAERALPVLGELVATARRASVAAWREAKGE